VAVKRDGVTGVVFRLSEEEVWKGEEDDDGEVEAVARIWLNGMTRRHMVIEHAIRL